MTLPSAGTRPSQTRIFLSAPDSGAFPSSPMQSALAVGDASEGGLRAIAEASGVIFRGYTGRYRYAQAGGSEFSVFEDGLERGDAPGRLHFGHESDSHWKLRVRHVAFADRNRADPLVAAVRGWCGKGLLGREFPVLLGHADCAPALAPGDDLLPCIAFVAQRAKIFARGQDKDCGVSPLDPHGFKALPASLETAKVRLSGFIYSAQPLCAGQGPRGLRVRDKVVLTVGTVYGPIAAAITAPKEMITEILTLCQPEKGLPCPWIVAEGWLAADCATGEYQTGAQYDPLNLARYVRGMIGRRAVGRLFPVLAEDASLAESGRVIAKGRKAVLEELFRRYGEKAGFERERPWKPVLALGRASEPGKPRRLIALEDAKRRACETIELSRIEDSRIREIRVERPRPGEVTLCRSTAEWLSAGERERIRVLSPEGEQIRAMEACLSDWRHSEFLGCWWLLKTFGSEVTCYRVKKGAFAFPVAPESALELERRRLHSPRESESEESARYPGWLVRASGPGPVSLRFADNPEGLADTEYLSLAGLPFRAKVLAAKDTPSQIAGEAVLKAEGWPFEAGACATDLLLLPRTVLPGGTWEGELAAIARIGSLRLSEAEPQGIPERRAETTSFPFSGRAEAVSETQFGGEPWLAVRTALFPAQGENRGGFILYVRKADARGLEEGAAFTADIQLYARFSRPFEGVPGHA